MFSPAEQSVELWRGKLQDIYDLMRQFGAEQCSYRWLSLACEELHSRCRRGLAVLSYKHEQKVIDKSSCLISCLFLFLCYGISLRRDLEWSCVKTHRQKKCCTSSHYSIIVEREINAIVWLTWDTTLPNRYPHSTSDRKYFSWTRRIILPVKMSD